MDPLDRPRTIRFLNGGDVRRALPMRDAVEAMQAGLIGRGHIRAELGELVAGTKPGRPDPGAVTHFKSVGNAIQDLAAASIALANAEKLGIGTEVRL